MNVLPTSIRDVLILEPRVFGDERGFFYESYNDRDFHKATGLSPRFVQDNHSRSARNVLRGLHYQVRAAQGKLVRATIGEVYDVAVDLRKNSPTFGEWTAHVLSDENHHMLWVPAGFAHDFLVTSDYAEVQYKATDYYAPEFERCLVWNDPQLAIPWPVAGEPVISGKDREGRRLGEVEVFE